METKDSTQTFIAGASVLKYRRVNIVEGKIVHCGATDLSIGVCQGDYLTDRNGAVRLKNDTGTFAMEAAGAITQWAKVHGAADGKIAATGDLEVGIAKSAASGDGDVVEVIPLPETDVSA